MNTKTYFAYWAERYKDELTNNILPFWLEHGLDHKHGGIYTCLDRDGKLMDTTKSVWFQGRAGYIFDNVYNHIDARPAGDAGASAQNCSAILSNLLQVLTLHGEYRALKLKKAP